MKRMYWFHDALQAAFESNGLFAITRAQAFVISNILAGEYKASNIAKNLGVSRQAVSQTLMELERIGCIELAPDPSDKRSRIVTLSAEFADHGETCAHIFDALEEELGRRIGQRKLVNLRESVEAEWGEPPQIGNLAAAAPSPKTEAIAEEREVPARGSAAPRARRTRS
ncbi:MAG TPA: MarR family transcriptional regulator [Sphingobium sp.]|nr:MarR family transcriptional regulator [Sphingobium sp.]